MSKRLRRSFSVLTPIKRAKQKERSLSLDVTAGELAQKEKKNVRFAGKAENILLVELQKKEEKRKQMIKHLAEVAKAEFPDFLKRVMFIPYSTEIGLFCSLPEELHHLIFSFLGMKEVVAFASVANFWRSRKEIMWQLIFKRDCELKNQFHSQEYGATWEYLYRSKMVDVSKIKRGTRIGYGPVTQKILGRGEGQWEDTELKGYGMIYYDNGCVMEGIFDGAGECKGRGIYYNGDEYKGIFRHGRCWGYGTYFYYTGSKYEGEWKANSRCGHGTKWHYNGDKYVGNWKNSHEEGHGIKWYYNGDVYEGNWRRGYQSGQGKMTYANNDVYVGEWRSDKKHGYGEMTYADGSKYCGNWKNDKWDSDNGLLFSKVGKQRYLGVSRHRDYVTSS